MAMVPFKKRPQAPPGRDQWRRVMQDQMERARKDAEAEDRRISRALNLGVFFGALGVFLIMGLLVVLFGPTGTLALPGPPRRASVLLTLGSVAGLVIAGLFLRWRQKRLIWRLTHGGIEAEIVKSDRRRRRLTLFRRHEAR